MSSSTSRRITPRAGKVIREGLASGRTLRDIAAEVELAPSTVLRWARRAGLAAVPPSGRVAGGSGGGSRTRPTKARPVGASEASPAGESVGDELAELLEVAARLKVMLRRDDALAPADVARLSGELRACLKQITKARDAARMSADAAVERSAERVREKLRAQLESAALSLVPAPDETTQPELRSAR